MVKARAYCKKENEFISVKKAKEDCAPTKCIHLCSVVNGKMFHSRASRREKMKEVICLKCKSKLNIYTDEDEQVVFFKCPICFSQQSRTFTKNLKKGCWRGSLKATVK